VAMHEHCRVASARTARILSRATTSWWAYMPHRSTPHPRPDVPARPHGHAPEPLRLRVENLPAPAFTECCFCIVLCQSTAAHPLGFAPQEACGGPPCQCHVNTPANVRTRLAEASRGHRSWAKICFGSMVGNYTKSGVSLFVECFSGEIDSAPHPSMVWWPGMRETFKNHIKRLHLPSRGDSGADYQNDLSGTLCGCSVLQPSQPS